MNRFDFGKLSDSGNWPLIRLKFIISNRVGATVSADVFKILGVMPSRPVAFVTSSDFKDVMRLVIFMRGMPNWTVFGILVFM